MTGRLPRGRHGLSRAEVATQQRGRIVRALAEELAERGYVDTPVSAVLRRAGVSRETFYEQFASKQDCFVAALEQAVGELGDRLAAVLAGATGPPLERLSLLLDGYLDALAGQPALARLFLVETYAAGPAAMRRRLELQQSFVDAVAELLGGPVARPAATALVAAAIGLVTAWFAPGGAESGDLAQVLDPVLDLAAAWLGRAGT